MEAHWLYISNKVLRDMRIGDMLLLPLEVGGSFSQFPE